MITPINQLNIVVDGMIFEVQRHGGVSRIYHEILPRISTLDKSIHFTLLTAGKLKQSLPQAASIQHQNLDYWEMILRPRSLFRQARGRGRCRVQSAWLQKNQIDIWHSTYYTVPTNWRGSIVITVYDLIFSHYPQMFNKRQLMWTNKQIKRAVLAADVVICISETTRADLIQVYDIEPSKLYVIPLGVDPVFRKTKAENMLEQGKRPFLLYVGSRDKYKNFITLLRAYCRWDYRHEIDLLVVGSEWTWAETQQLQDFAIEANVRLETAVTDQELALLYNQAVAFIYPSLYEGFGLPIVEAMACGCPIVASKIPTSMEIAKDVACFFDPESVEGLLVALDKVVAEGRSTSRVQAGLQLAAAYRWENTARQTLEVYHALV